MEEAFDAIRSLHEEKDNEIEELQSERDTLNYEKTEIEEEKRDMERKLEYNIYEAVFNECKYNNGAYGECGLSCPDWGGNLVDTIVTIHEQMKEKMIEMQREIEKLKIEKLKSANFKLRNLK